MLVQSHQLKRWMVNEAGNPGREFFITEKYIDWRFLRIYWYSPKARALIVRIGWGPR